MVRPTARGGERRMISFIKKVLNLGYKPSDHDVEINTKSVVLVWLTALGIILFLIWAYLFEIDEMVRGQGQVVPSQRVQLIQNLEGGIVQDLIVQEGQTVEKDDIVMRIDNELAGSHYREALIRSLEHEASIIMYEALIAGDEPKYRAEIVEFAELVKRQNDILLSERAKSKAERDVLALQLETKEREAAEKVEHRKQIQASLKLAEKQRNLAIPALRAKAYSELQFLDLEQKVQNLKAELAVLEHSIPRLESAVKEAKERLNLHQVEFEAKFRNALNEEQIQLLSLKELLSAGDDRVKRTEMRSPVRGIVKTIHANTIGGVVAPGATVIEIVPLDDSLIIEAKFSPADIAFLYPGQKAIVRLTAYDFSVYGGVEAQVEQISADTLEGQQGEIFYQVKVRTTAKGISHDGEILPILPGMTAEVDIITGKKTILDYLLKPLFKASRRAFREK